MDVEHNPFPCGQLESDFEKARHLTTLLAPRNNNRGENKKQNQCRDTAWSSDNKLFAWSCGQKQVKVMSADDINNNVQPDECVTIDCWQVVTALEFAALGRCQGCRQLANKGQDYRMLRWEEHSDVLITGFRNGRIRVVDVKNGSTLLELLDHTDHVSHLQFIPDENLTLASASHDGSIKFWDLADDGNMRTSIRPAEYLGSRGGSHKVMCIASSPDTLRLAAVGTFKTVVIFDMKTLGVTKKLNGHANHVNCCEFGPDGILLITASVDTTAIIWNSYSGQVLTKLGHQYPPPPAWFPCEDDTNVIKCVFTGNGLEVVTVATDGYVRFWDLSESFSPAGICEVDDPLCCSSNPDGDRLAIGTAGGDVVIVKSICKTRSLATLCRTVINKTDGNSYTGIDKLFIPANLKSFLKYEDIYL